MKKTHTILIPNMAITQFRLLEYALRYDGYKCEILGNCGSAVAQLGLKYVHNDTCYPALLVIGQFLDALNSGKYDLDHTALLITQTGGGCRASNYIYLLRKALVKAGYPQIPVASLNFSGLEKDSGFQMTLPLARRALACIFYGDMLCALRNQVAPYENEVKLYGMTDDLTSQLATGLSVKVYGADAETLTAVSEKVVEMVNDTEGFANADNGLGSGDATIILKVDRDKARAYGLTVAQVYQQIAAKLTTTATAQTPVTVNGTTMDVQITNNLDPVTKENMMELTFETTEMSADGTVTTGTCTLNDIASWSTGTAPDAITSENQTEYVTVTADTLKGYNTMVQSRVLQKKLDEYAASGEMPEGCSISLGGETESTDYMVNEMVQWMALALPFVYLVMVAQFQSLLSPFIVLMGTVVNNGIVFVDYANQLRLGGMERRAALVATGRTRMRPILMTTLTTVLAMLQLVFSGDMASQLMSGMAIVIICGLSYATLMTLYIVPVLYDVMFKKPPLNVDVGSDDDLDDIPDDAAEFIAAQKSAGTAQPEA